MFQKLMTIPAMLQLFAEPNTNVTTDGGLSKEMKTFYDKALIRLAEPELVHDQFAQKRPIPKNGGKTIEFRKYTPLAKQLTELTEGVTPDGQKLTVTTIEATVKQYGGYITLSDQLLLTAIDNNLMEAITLLSSQAARTSDTITREVMVAGTNVQYAEGQVDSRAALAYTDETDNMNLTVRAVRMATRTLKNQNAKRIGNSYVGIVHPDASFDLMSDPEWKYPHQYKDTSNLYAEEIGEVGGVRFVETTEAKKFVSAGASGRDVYATMILGANAYGVTEVTGGGLQTIVKQLGSAGTADPLNQRATAGWKLMKTAVRLVEEYMVRVETTSSVNDHIAN
ncbi:N4-gp56 family major capsid protein [Dysosmobacter sp. Marseille-Q4140]|nr:N4-gp56 family major capsid protein [Dysosmobacter sp. Marseille-Q4140]